MKHSRVKNYETLARSSYRRDMLALIDAAYDAIDTDSAINNQASLSDAVLTIQNQKLDLSAFKNVYIVGCGKVACRAAATIENILQHFIAGGAVVGISPHACEIVTTYTGTHPKPSEINFAASEHIMDVSIRAGADDLVIAIIGGGGSSLMCSSAGECEQQGRLYDAFLHSGGTIDEMNIVRKHLSGVKGGGLAKLLYPATVLSLIFSDVPGGNPATVASGPTFLDTSTLDDARAIITRYNLGDFDLNETPKEKKYFEKVQNILVVSNLNALEAMRSEALSRGYEPVFPACDPYTRVDELISSIFDSARPGTVSLFSGEPRIVVPPDCTSRGGRNSYVTLSALESLRERQVFSSFASDGRDNGDMAGAIADEETRSIVQKARIDLAEKRRGMDSHSVFALTRDAIDTGPIEANVSDLCALITPA